MKRLFGLFFAVLLFAGCSKAALPLDHKAGKAASSNAFEAAAELIWRDHGYTAQMSRGGDGRLYLKLSGKDLAVPLEYILEQGALVVNQGELSLKIPQGEAPENCIAIELSKALSALSDEEAKKEDGMLLLEDGKLGAKLLLEEGNYRFSRLDLEGGTFLFTSFEFLGNGG